MASTYIGLGYILAQQGKLEDAEKAYRTAISIDPNLASSWIGLGNVLAQQQRYHESLDAYNNAIKRDPNKAPKLKDIMDSVKLKEKLDKNLSLLNEENYNAAILLDTSSSMQGQKISDAKEVIIKAVKSISIKHNPINFIFFGASICAYCLESNQISKSRDDVINRIKHIEADGKTPLLGALNHAWEFLKSRENKIIIIVTDGNPTDSSPDYILDYAKSLKRAGCRIISFGIGKGTEINEDFLRKMASNEEDFHLADVNLNFKVASYVDEFIYPSESH